MTVKEFSAAANVTTQRIYKLYAMGCATNCNGVAAELHKYFKLVNGKKYVHCDALRLFDNATELHNVTQQSTTDDAMAQSAITALQQQLEVLQQQLTVKDAQLSAKDKQIEQLTAALQAAQEQQTALTTALTQQQALHAGDIQRQLVEQCEPSESEPEIIPEPEPKRSLFSRLFKRK